MNNKLILIISLFSFQSIKPMLSLFRNPRLICNSGLSFKYNSLTKLNSFNSFNLIQQRFMLNEKFEKYRRELRQIKFNYDFEKEYKELEHHYEGDKEILYLKKLKVNFALSVYLGKYSKAKDFLILLKKYLEFKDPMLNVNFNLYMYSDIIKYAISCENINLLKILMEAYPVGYLFNGKVTPLEYSCLVESEKSFEYLLGISPKIDLSKTTVLKLINLVGLHIKDDDKKSRMIDLINKKS